IEAALKTTRTVPVVGVDMESDPVAKGWVATMAKPGGNFTGFFLDAPEISAKQLQFLKGIRPNLTRVRVLGDERVKAPQFGDRVPAAPRFGITLDVHRIGRLDEVDHAMAEIARQRAGAVVVLTSPLVFNNAAHVAALATKHQLLSICPFSPRFV